jgi:excisionase family DNA binding protein
MTIREAAFPITAPVEEIFLHNTRVIQKTFLRTPHRADVRMYTTEEVARIFDVTPAAVRYWARKGKIKAVREGEKWLIPEEEVERLRKEVGGGAEENGGGKAGETCLNPDAAKAFAKALLEAAAEFLRENPWVLEVLGLRPGEEERRLASTVLEAARSHQPKKNELAEIFWTALAEKLAERAAK